MARRRTLKRKRTTYRKSTNKKRRRTYRKTRRIRGGELSEIKLTNMLRNITPIFLEHAPADVLSFYRETLQEYTDREHVKEKYQLLETAISERKALPITVHKRNTFTPLDWGVHSEPIDEKYNSDGIYS